jgi:two-component system KDP operon response regulator KdpE
MTPSLNVLVVDDEPPLRKVLRTSLSARGFSVEEAGSAESAFELIGQRLFDLILLDINMPRISGVEACRRIRSLMPQVGIVMVTVRDGEQDVVQALEAGADDYITKPFRFGELVARLRAVLRRTGPESSARMLRAGDLEIDLERRLLRRSGAVVHLTPTEFDLLALLMRNEGVLLPHAKLLRTVWGPEYGEELEYLRSYVRTLRKKIEADPTQPKYILTEPWVGYRFHNPSENEMELPAGEEGR